MLPNSPDIEVTTRASVEASMQPQMSNTASTASPRTEMVDTLLEMINGSWIAQAIAVTAELNLADLLREGPLSSTDLAAVTGTDAPSLHRLLRALTTISICHESDDGRFCMTEMGRLLGSDSPDSLRCWSMWWGKHLWPVWGNLQYSVTTGKSARTLLTGTQGFKHLENDPTAASTFNQALVELTRLTTSGVVQAYDFSGCQLIVDVGGGYGALLSAILCANPNSQGILFDLPHATEGARRHFEQSDLSNRCNVVAGDFFQSVPQGADAYVLKSVIHDWNDDKSREILTTCRNAMPDDARLLLVERVMPQRLEATTTHQSAVRSDLTMLVALGAQERTEIEFRNLLHSAGFELTRIYPAGMVSVLEAHRISKLHRQ